MSAPNMTMPGSPETLAAGVGQLADAAATAVRELLDGCIPGDPILPRLETVRRALERLSEVSGQLRVATQRRAARATPMDLSAVVRDLSDPMQRMLGPFITFDTEPTRRAWMAGDRAAIEQVVLGLTINAREALPLGGHVRVVTDRWVVSERTAFQVGTLEAGAWSVVEVRHRGAGADPRVIHRLFDPAAADASIDPRLALPAVAAIVSDFAGELVLHADGNGGAILAACFPSVEAPKIRQPATGIANAVLVADSDEWTRLSAVRTLRRAGIGVLEAAHAEDAAELLSDVAGSCVRVIVADAAIVVDGGLGDLVRRERPEIDLVVMTRSAATQPAVGALELAKPFSPDDLVQLVKARLAPAS